VFVSLMKTLTTDCIDELIWFYYDNCFGKWRIPNRSAPIASGEAGTSKSMLLKEDQLECG
jgi:hypothetical protein